MNRLWHNSPKYMSQEMQSNLANIENVDLFNSAWEIPSLFGTYFMSILPKCSVKFLASCV